MNYELIGYQIDESRGIRHIRNGNGDIIRLEPDNDIKVTYKVILRDEAGCTIHAEVPEYYFSRLYPDKVIANKTKQFASCE